MYCKAGKGMSLLTEREGLLVTLWLTESSAYQAWQSIMVSHTAVSTVQLINCSMGYHHRLSGFTCRAQNQPPSYREDIANRSRDICHFKVISSRNLCQINLLVSTVWSITLPSATNGTWRSAHLKKSRFGVLSAQARHSSKYSPWLFKRKVIEVKNQVLEYPKCPWAKVIVTISRSAVISLIVYLQLLSHTASQTEHMLFIPEGILHYFNAEQYWQLLTSACSYPIERQTFINWEATTS